MSVEDPVASLALADAASRRLAGRARWAGRYYVLQAAFWLVAIPFVGLTALAVPSGYYVMGALLLLAGSWLMDAWADRHGVVLRGSRRLRRTSDAATVPLTIGALVLGWIFFRGEPTFWISAALVVAVPSLVAAVLAGRAADPR